MDSRHRGELRFPTHRVSPDGCGIVDEDIQQMQELRAQCHALPFLLSARGGIHRCRQPGLLSATRRTVVAQSWRETWPWDGDRYLSHGRDPSHGRGVWQPSVVRDAGGRQRTRRRLGGVVRQVCGLLETHRSTPRILRRVCRRRLGMGHRQPVSCQGRCPRIGLGPSCPAVGR